MAALKSNSSVVHMPRRGISEVVASILLVAVVAVASFLAVNTSTKQIAENEKTVEETLSEKGMQIQELLSVISSREVPSKIIIEMINYGIKDIVLDSVHVDGRKSAFILKNGDVIITNKIIPKKEILILETNTTGSSVQLITDTGNIINIKTQ